MNELLQDLKFGLRTLRKSPGFTIVALATLAIGIGANTAIFSFVDAVLLKPLPYAEPDRIVSVLERIPNGGTNAISVPDYLDWEKQNTVFAYLAAQKLDLVSLSGAGNPVPMRDGRVSAHYFDVFGVRAAIGRTFAEGEDQDGHDHVVVLSHALWESQFGGDPHVVGQLLIIDGEPHTVIGVLPAGGAFDRKDAEMWRPLAFHPKDTDRGTYWFDAFARLKPGVSLEEARAQMGVIAARIARDYPDSKKGWGVAITPLAEAIVGRPLRQSLYLLLAAVGMILLIACANLANLTLARGVAREREVAIRAALGAGRWRLVRQFLTESVLLSAAGGTLGLGAGYAITGLFKTAMPARFLPPEADIAIDGRVLLFTAALSLLTGIVFGLVPALQATRPDLISPIKAGGTASSAGRAHRRLRSALVVAEVAVAFVLLTGAGLLIRSLVLLQRIDPGFDSTNVLTAVLPVPPKRFSDAAAFNLHQHGILDGLAALPGVRDVALTSVLPLRGWNYGMSFRVAGRPVGDRADGDTCFFKMVSFSYFRALGMKLERGRLLDDRDVTGSAPVAVINRTMARKFFRNEDPIGQHLLISKIPFDNTHFGPDVSWEIVGIVADEKVRELDDKSDNPGVYVTDWQSVGPFESLVVRGAVDPLSLRHSIEDVVHRIDRDQVLSNVETLAQVESESLGPNRFRSLLFGLFGGVALLLSAVGLYGVISYSVEQRTREIGIRSALGASPGDILRPVLRNGMALTGIGLVLGLAGALVLTRLMASLLFGAGERDPVTLATVAATLAAAGLLACYIPARRATRVSPMVALRYE